MSAAPDTFDPTSVQKRRVTTDVRDGESRIAEDVLLDLLPSSPKSIPDFNGLSIVTLCEDEATRSRFLFFYFPPNILDQPQHQTQTIDYVYILDGEIDMIVPDQPVVHLRAGDSVVQRGASHAWRTTSSHCVLVASMIGTDQAQ